MAPRPMAVALSGGGHRACVFALGVLLYLADAGRNQHVASIASVSGGSLANAALGDRLDFTSASASEVRALVRDVASKVASRRLAPSKWARRLVLAWAALALVGVWLVPVDDLVRVAGAAVGLLVLLVMARVVLTGGGPLFGWWGTWAYIGSVIALAELIVVGALQLRGSAELRDALDVVGRPGWADSNLLIAGVVLLGLALAAWLLSLRGRVAGRAFAHTLFENGPRARLTRLDRSLDHVICATELHAGHHAYFSGRFVYNYDFGVGEPGSFRLHAATQASAAFPGAFPPRTARRSALSFPASPFARLVLVDGGVYDNMADQWHQGLGERLPLLGTAAQTVHQAEELVVVSASAGLGPDPLRRFWIPLLGELFALLRDKSVMYDNGNSLRRQALVDRFATTSPPGGALVHITQSPLKVPAAFLDSGDAACAARAQNAIDALLAADSEQEWGRLAAGNAAVPTTLIGFTDEVTVRLLRHAYVLAMVNLHVILGHPLLDIPSASDFEDLV